MRIEGRKVKNQFELKKKMKDLVKEYKFALVMLEDKDIYVYNDDSIIGNYLRLNKIEYNLIEDGLNCYQNIEKHYCFDRTLKEKIKNMLNTPDACFGKSRYVKKIEVEEHD